MPSILDAVRLNCLERSSRQRRACACVKSHATILGRLRCTVTRPAEPGRNGWSGRLLGRPGRYSDHASATGVYRRAGKGSRQALAESRMTTEARIHRMEQPTHSEHNIAKRSDKAGKDDLIMGVGFGRSSVADVTFQVFNRSLHPEWFTTREFRRVEQKRWSADARIVEGGHVVAFSCGAVRLTEVLCGPETVLPEPGRLFHSHLRRERSAMLRPDGTVEYQCCLEVERVDVEIFLHLCEEIALTASGNRLFRRFPASNRLAPPRSATLN